MNWLQKIGLICLMCLVLGTMASAAILQYVSVTYTPAPAEPGKLATVWVTLKNNSSQIAQSVLVEPKESYPFVIGSSTSSRLDFNEIQPFQSVTGKLEVQVDKTALNGTYTLDITTQEQGSGLTGVLYNLPVQVLSSNPQIEIISATTPTATPGQPFESEITLKNIGSSRAINILFGTFDDRTVTTTGVVVERPIKNIGPSYSFIEALSPGETNTFKLKFGVDSTADQKTHLVPVKIKYQDENRTETEVTRYLGVLVQAKAEMDSYLSYDSTAKPYPGGTTTASVNLFNRGAATGRNVVVELTESAEIQILSEKKVFIGTLDPDDFDSFKLSLLVSSTVAPGSYPIGISYEFKNQDNQTEKVQKTLDVQVFAKSQANGNGVSQGSILDLVIPGIVVLVILYLGYRRFGPKKAK